MLPLALLPASIAVSLDGVVLDEASVTLLLRSVAASCCCPLCGSPSHRVHSRYSRTIADLPLQGRVATLQLVARRFFCTNAVCSRSVFCERLPDLLPARARCTSRLTDSHRAIAFAVGGQAGSALATQLAMPTSPATLLRRIKQSELPAEPTPRVLGVDDWAMRKGLSYGTILVDLERHRVIDLLPGRDKEPLKKWLQEHPGVEVISRDRASAYAQAATEAVPHAVQVADRWHLLKNVREMLERFFERHRGKLRLVSACLTQSPAVSAAAAEQQPMQTPQPLGVAVPDSAQPAAQSDAESSPQQQAEQPEAASLPQQQAMNSKQQRRLERYQEVRQRHAEGLSVRQIARELRVSRRAVRCYLRQDHCPDGRRGQPRRTTVDAYGNWIDEQIRAGQSNAAAMYLELKARGYSGSSSAVLRFVRKRLAALGKVRRGRGRTPRPIKAARPESLSTPAVGSKPALSTRMLTFDVLRAPVRRHPQQQARVDLLRGLDEEFAEVMDLAEWFMALARKERSEPLSVWLARAEKSTSQEMRGFAQSIARDQAAVAAAMSQPWSNGPVEGKVNRLKVIKREMFGRAGFALLRLRVLHAG